jgi:hypothetical protein
MVTEQMLEMPLPVGSYVELYEDVRLDADKGSSAGVIFTGTVEQYVPDTGLLVFEDSSVGRAEFRELLEEADGYKVLANYE